jgi:hypothetical protein
MAKEYLDYAGLKQYDAAIKKYIADHTPEGTEVEPYDDSALVADINDLKNMDATLLGDLNALKTLVGNTPVADQITAAIEALVNGAPHSLDTLKEIADWINTHGEAASDLVTVVAEQGEAIAALDAKVDAIKAISGTYIDALFLTPVELEDGQTVQDAIAALNEDEKLVLTEDVAEDLTIGKDAVIEAEDVVFSGTVTVDKDAAVTIIGASFTGQVVVA